MQNNRLSADAQRTIARTAALRTEFEAMSTAELQKWHSGYSQIIATAWSAESAERYLEKVHIIAGILHERMEAAAEMIEAAEIDEYADEDAIDAEDFDGDAEAAREAADYEAAEQAREEEAEAAREADEYGDEFDACRDAYHDMQAEADEVARLRRLWEWGQAG